MGRKIVIIVSIIVTVALTVYSITDSVKELKKVDGRRKNDPTKARQAKEVKKVIDSEIEKENGN